MRNMYISDMFASASTLSRQRKPSVPSLHLVEGCPDPSLPLARLHEACGPARHRFALWLALRLKGPVLWIAPSWSRDQLGPNGITTLIDPARLIFVHPRRPEDILWCMEETLRAGTLALAVADSPGLPNLTQVRRMHLAAETGAKEGAGQTPLGLLLTPGTGGAQGVETRWHLSPDHAETPGHWHLSRLRARAAPPATWRVSQNLKESSLRIEHHPCVFPH